MNKNPKWQQRRSIYTLDVGIIKISVTNGHIDYPGEWIMSCYPFFHTYKINANTLEEAQDNTVSNVMNKVNEMYSVLKSAFPGLKE